MIACNRKETNLDAATIEAALNAMSADELRSLFLELQPWFDEDLQVRFANAVVERAARNDSGWVPPGPTDIIVKDVDAFAKAATRVGFAEPSEVDAYLRDGSNAFLGKNYAAAFQIFRALLIPLGSLDIDLGVKDRLK